MAERRPADARGAADQSGTVMVDGERVSIAHIELSDGVLAGLLASTEPERRAEVVENALRVGARGLASMGIGVDIAHVDERVSQSVERVTAEAADRVRSILDQAHRSMTDALDPEQRSSVVAKTVSDFTAWRDSFLATIDPDAGGSHTHRLLSQLEQLLGPDGTFDRRLREALDPQSDGSGLSKMTELIDRRFLELRELMAEQRGRQEEADRGTAKGFDFEDRVEETLRALARPLGAIVERTSLEPGELGGDAKVGDFVVELGSGDGRIAVEAKNVRSISLTGKHGMLGELDRAMANRDAQVAICVSARDAFPQEVGVFGVYGNRILVVDDGDGTMLSVAIRWASLLLAGDGAGSDQIDVGAAEESLQRIRRLGQRFSSNKRTLTDIAGSVEKVRDSLEEMRRELLDTVDETNAILKRPSAADVVEIRQVG